MNDYTLSNGPHDDPEDGRCAMEWVAFIAGEPHSDKPACVSPLVARFCVAANDISGDFQRQRLRPYLTRCIGTADDGFDAERKRILGLPEEYDQGEIDDLGQRGDLVWGIVSELIPDRNYEPHQLDQALAVLDRLLPTVTVDLPAPVFERAREVCGS